MEKSTGKYHKDDYLNFENQINKTIPVIEEEVKTDIEITSTGSVLIQKKVHSENIFVDTPVTSENIQIDRVSINQIVDEPPAPIRHEGETIIIPVLKEIMVKKILIVEEVRVSKQIQSTLQTDKIELKKEEVIVTRKDKL